MKKVLNTRTYSPDNAEFIAEYYASKLYGTFDWFEESLYRAKNGQFFLKGRGNAMTKYHKKIGAAWVPGAATFLLTEDEAKDWIKKYTNKYDEIFKE